MSRWGHRALNLALGALGVALTALLYALVSHHLGGTRAVRSQDARASEAAATRDARGAGGRAAGETPAGQAPSQEAAADEIIQVSVRNGCGKDGLAAGARDFLVRAGFDVVEVGNYTTFDLDSSMVVDRVGNLAAARRVARALGIPERRVRQEISKTYYLDASVVLGRDYRSLEPFSAREESATAVR